MRPTPDEIQALLNEGAFVHRPSISNRMEQWKNDMLVAILRQNEALLDALGTTEPPPDPPPPDPDPPPPSGDFPGPSNTGVPPGTVLTPSSITETTSHGQVLDGLHLTSRLHVKHDGVLVRNCLIQAGGQAIYVNGNLGLVVMDCELDGTGATSGESIIAEHNYDMHRCNIHHIGEGPRSNGNVYVQDCWMHDFADFIAQGAHQDGIQVTSGSHHWFNHNTIDIGLPDGSNAAIFAGTFPGSDVLISNNLLRGGSYTVAVHGYDDVTVRNNHFAIAHDPNGAGVPSSGWHGALLLDGCTNVDEGGNVWHDGPNEGQLIS